MPYTEDEIKANYENYNINDEKIEAEYAKYKDSVKDFVVSKNNSEEVLVKTAKALLNRIMDMNKQYNLDRFNADIEIYGLDMTLACDIESVSELNEDYAIFTASETWHGGGCSDTSDGEIKIPTAYLFKAFDIDMSWYDKICKAELERRKQKEIDEKKRQIKALQSQIDGLESES